MVNKKKQTVLLTQRNKKYLGFNFVKIIFQKYPTPFLLSLEIAVSLRVQKTLFSTGSFSTIAAMLSFSRLDRTSPAPLTVWMKPLSSQTFTIWLITWRFFGNFRYSGDFQTTNRIFAAPEVKLWPHKIKVLRADSYKSDPLTKKLSTQTNRRSLENEWIMWHNFNAYFYKFE